MGIFADIVKGALSPITKLVDELFTSEDEKLAAKAVLAQIEADLAEKAMEYEATLVKEQGATIRAEMLGHSWLQRNWRPILALTFGGVVVYAVVAPALGAPLVNMSGVPDRMWTLLVVMIGGGVMGRSVEKIVPSVVNAMKRKETM